MTLVMPFCHCETAQPPTFLLTLCVLVQVGFVTAICFTCFTIRAVMVSLEFVSTLFQEAVCCFVPQKANVCRVASGELVYSAFNRFQPQSTYDEPGMF